MTVSENYLGSNIVLKMYKILFLKYLSTMVSLILRLTIRIIVGVSFSVYIKWSQWFFFIFFVSRSSLPRKKYSDGVYFLYKQAMLSYKVNKRFFFSEKTNLLIEFKAFQIIKN